jgi:hypothetical protein
MLVRLTKFARCTVCGAEHRISSCAANIEDIYRLQAADVLEVASDVSVGGRSVVTTQVYKKQDRWRPRFTWSGGLFG